MENRDTGYFGANGYDIFNRKEQGRILSARPNTKVLLGMNYDLKKQLSF
jgi:iron complex outermembrane receptor protein